jgi:beta-N-acetylhexosaminidase
MLDAEDGGPIMADLPPRPLMVSLAGPEILPEEAEAIRRLQPLGFILFRRNIPASQEALAELNSALRSLVKHDCVPIAIDQEGGRVQRLQPPLVDYVPPAALYRTLYALDPVATIGVLRQDMRRLGKRLAELGFTMNCAPVLDLAVVGAHDIIGDRSYGDRAESVVVLAGVAAEALLQAGVWPVLKHVPGHGRALLDSHKALPRVETPLSTLESMDFLPFAALGHFPCMMTAHVCYTALDSELPVTVSPRGIAYIRERLGYRHYLVSDALEMEALEGSIGERARATLAAGVDIALYCRPILEALDELVDAVDPWTVAQWQDFSLLWHRVSPTLAVSTRDRATQETTESLTQRVAPGLVPWLRADPSASLPKVFYD